VIATEGLTKHYGSVEALVDLTLDVRPGEIFGFLGPNGAGKSTMIRTLLGFLHPTRGSATVLGLDVVADSVEIRRRTGYLPGGIALYDSLSGADALEYLADLQHRGSAMRDELCERLQMSKAVLRRKVRDYSRGMRQKIGVIQALQHDPELAILDEPTEGLDPLMQHAFYALMDDQRAKGRTTFFSSHVLSEVERICDRVAIIRSGHLMALQNVTELLARRKKKVELRWRGAAPDLAGIPGLADVEVNGDRMRATLQGDVSGFVRAIASPSLEDLTIEPARLEEAFLEYYAGDEASEEMRG
jgi:ABC-2 type transport system ATP-binding protein